MTRQADDRLNVYSHPRDVPDLQENWIASQEGAAYFRCSHLNYMDTETGRTGEGKRVAVLKTKSGPDLTLPFTIGPYRHNFVIGERRLGSLGAVGLWLANPWMADGHAPKDIAKLLAHVIANESVDIIALGEIPQQSSLRAALDELPSSARKMRLGRKEDLHWMIDLPDSFEDYLSGLSASTRQSAKRKVRKLQKDFDVQFETIHDAASVDRFLEEGEKISRRTYQWNVGQRLCNDAETRASFMALAEQGRLRCYLLSLDGTPRAFLRGTVEGNLYNYETPGFDPEFAKHSIGTVILLMAIEELIGNTACRVFDFGSGGDETGYKSTFGNRSITCNSYYVVNARRPRALMILYGQTLLTSVKNLAALIIPEGDFRNKIKRLLRKYGT